MYKDYIGVDFNNLMQISLTCIYCGIIVYSILSLIVFSVNQAWTLFKSFLKI